MILAFALYFSWYSIRRYETLHAYTADLSLIDQAMWNTLHGRFLEATWGDRQQPRTAEHFEPILIPLATLFWLWDDVRVLLIAQSLALALGAWPLYRLARSQLPAEASPFLPLLFPAMYLLAPPLQAAAVADFHADPFVVAPFLFAFERAVRRRWGGMWFWAAVVMLTKENMPTLTAMLGLYLLLRPPASGVRPRWRAPSFRHGLALVAVSAVWFAVATFGIVAPLARTYFGTAGPIYLAARFSANPLTWPALLADPARLRYLFGLLATTGGLALLAPHYLLLGLPIFIANTFSNFPGQYSGEQHYSAPLVAVLMIAAVYGLVQSSKFKVRQSSIVHRPSSIVLRLLPLLALFIALGYHTLYGWTPLSRRAERFPVTAHTRLLPRFLAPIPADARVSASAAVHPHLAHRPVAYTFPIVADAEYILVDVTDVPGAHPNDVRARLEDLLASGDWRLLDAADGFLLLKREADAGPQTLPDAFFSFARAPDAAPEYPLDITFGDAVRLLGFDVLDAPFERRVSLRLYWQALRPNLPADLRLWAQLYDDAGQPLTDPVLQPAVAAVWYPPSRWRAGEVVVVQTLPDAPGDAFHLAAAVVRGDTLADFGRRLSARGASVSHDGGTWATVASFRRGGWALATLPPTLPLRSLSPLEATFGGGLRLTGVRLSPAAAVLRWETDAPLPFDYTLFLHLLDADGNLIAQADAQPGWLVSLPVTRWEPGRPILTGTPLPADLPPGRYRVRVGWYNWQTLERLPLAGGGDSLIVGEIAVSP